jgi:predicted RNA-binding protein with RPS1 domain
MNPFDMMDKKKNEFKQAPKIEQKAAEPVVNKEMQNFVIHSEIDAFLMDRIKSQPKTLEEVDVQIIEKPREGRHALSLPDEIQHYTKKYAFCWIFKRKQSIDEACDQLHYKLTNRTYFPELPDHIFSARGIIERGDNVLAFRPKALDEEMRKAPGIESINRIKSRMQAHEGDPNFYIPTSENSEDGKIVGV